MNRTHNLHDHHLYSVWNNIKTRCYNKNTHNYSNYGGKGIHLCDEWRHDFLSFYNWCISNGYHRNLTIDRIDNNQGYSPDNCRWVTIQIQQRNKSKYRGTKHKYIGVGIYKNTTGKCFGSSIRVDKKLIHLGSFYTPEEAAKARDQYITENNLIGYTKNFQL